MKTLLTDEERQERIEYWDSKILKAALTIDNDIEIKMEQIERMQSIRSKLTYL